MRESSRWVEIRSGAVTGFFIGLLAKELDLATLVSYHGDSVPIVVVSAALGALAAPTPLRKPVRAAAIGLALLWLLVAATPLTHWMGEGLVRSDPLVEADAVFVLGSGLQPDGDLTVNAMSRLVKGLQILGEGWAPRLVLSELPEPLPRYRDAACEIMTSLGMEQEVVAVGPVRNTRDEAMAVAALARDFAFENILLVTSPSHTRRAAAAFEAQGLSIVSIPSVETSFDYENLGRIPRGDSRITAFGSLIHEYAGLLYYRMRGWTGP